MRRSIVLVAAATTLVAGCSTGQGDPTVAATVGGVKVATVDQVQQRLNDLVARNPQVQEMAKQHKLDQVARAIVTHDVVHQLVVEAARQLNVTADESVVAQLAPVLTSPDQQQQQDPVTTAVEASYPVNDIARDKLLLAEMAQKSAGLIATTISAAFLSTADDARALAAKVAASPDQTDALLNAAAAGPTAAPGGGAIINRAFGGPTNPQDGSPTDTEGYLSAVQYPFTWVPEKTVLVWKQNSQDGGTSYAVLVIKQHTVAATPPAGIDTSTVSPLQLAQIGQGPLVGLAQDMGIQLNQRYGTWDPIDLHVIPLDQATAGNQILVPSTAKQ